MINASLMIVETLLPKEQLPLVARVVLRAQDIKEDSWDPERTRYNKSMIVAAKEAVIDSSLTHQDMWILVISDWNTWDWNDVQWWAEETLKQYGDKE
jgi:hypothetical protein